MKFYLFKELSSNFQDVATMQWKATKLDKKDFFGKSDPYLVFYRANEDGRLVWNVIMAKCYATFALGVVAEWSKVLTAVPWALMVWSTLALGTYQLRFVSWVFHVIFSFVHFISLHTLGGLRAFRKPLPYNMYLYPTVVCITQISGWFTLRNNLW